MFQKKEKARATRTRFSPVMIIMLVILVLYVLSLIVPFVWAFFTSFKDRLSFINDPVGLPQEWVWNYSTVFRKFYVQVTNNKIGTKLVYLDRMYLNSLLYAIGSAASSADCCIRLRSLP